VSALSKFVSLQVHLRNPHDISARRKDAPVDPTLEIRALSDSVWASDGQDMTVLETWRASERVMTRHPAAA